MLSISFSRGSYFVQLLRVGSSDKEEKVIAGFGVGGVAVTEVLCQVVHVLTAGEELAHAQQCQDGLLG